MPRSLRGGCEVLEVAIPVAISEFLRPFEDPFDYLPVLLERRLIAGPGEKLPEGDDEHEGAGEIGVEPVERMKAQPSCRISLDAIDDASRLFVASGVNCFSLQPCQSGQRAPDHVAAIESGGLPARGERVASPQVQEKGHTGGGREPLILLTFQKRERAQISHRVVGELHQDAFRSAAQLRSGLEPFFDSLFAPLLFLRRDGILEVNGLDP